MASSYSTQLRIELMTNGENDATWGTKTNTSLQLLEAAIAGRSAVTHDDTANYTLTTANGSADEARRMIIDISGALSAARNAVVPTQTKFYVVKNSTTGGYAVTVKTSAGSGVAVPNGKTMMLFCDGTNVVEAIDQVVGTLGLTSPAVTTSITTPSTTFALVNTTATTVNFAGAATTLNVGAGAASTATLSFTTGINLNTAAVASNQTTVALLNTTATTINFAGAATTLNIGAAASTTTLTGQALSFTGANSTNNTTLTVTNSSNAAAASHSIVDVAVGGTTSTGDPQTRWTIPSGTSWYAGADNSDSDSWKLGTGTAVGTNTLLTVTSGGAMTVADDLAVNGDSITTDDTTFNCFNTTATTVNAFGAATTLNIGAAGGAAAFPGGISIPTGKSVTGAGTAAISGFTSVSATSLAGTLTTAAQPNITSVGALNGGSITNGFGSIDIGADALTAGAISGTTLTETTGAAWTDYVPTLTTDAGTFGALTVTKARYRKLGKTLIIDFDCNAAVTSGSPTEFRLSLPTGTLAATTYSAAYIANNATQEIGTIGTPSGAAYIAFLRVAGAVFTGTVYARQTLIVELA